MPACAPQAIAEHTVALLLALNRKIHRAYNRVREGNFALDGLLGFDLAGKTVGIVGTGRIGEVVARSSPGSSAVCSPTTSPRTRPVSRSGRTTFRARTCSPPATW